MMGLANRIVAHGEARNAAEKLAKQISEFPQACMRSDRLSAYEQWDLPFKEAMQNEFKHGMCTIEKGETVEGAVRFSKGEGRHGVFGGSEGPGVKEKNRVRGSEDSRVQVGLG